MMVRQMARKASSAFAILGSGPPYSSVMSLKKMTYRVRRENRPQNIRPKGLRYLSSVRKV